MAPMPRLWTTNELHPPATPDDVKNVLDAVLTGSLDHERRAILRRALAGAERSDLRARAAALDPWVKKPREGEIETLVLVMSTGLGTKGEGEKESAIRVRHYAEILGDTPLWAIKRACDRFERGSVTAEELGERQIMRGMVPSTSHLYRVASAIARPVFHERIRINSALNGVVEHRMEHTAANKEQVLATANGLRRSLGSAGEMDEARLSLARENTAKESLRAAEAVRLKEFRDAGVDPPKVAPGGIGTSLSMMLRLGYRIIEHPEGGKTLVAPPKIAPSRRSEGMVL